mgnify:CR=1 FL=1
MLNGGLSNFKNCNILTLFFIITLLFSSAVFAEESNIVTSSEIVEKSSLVNTKINKEIKDSIALVYGKENVEIIYENVFKHIDNAKKQRPDILIKQDLLCSPNWYKNEIVYMFYVDQFGVVTDGENNTFKDASQMFDYLNDLGVTMLYILPFADSPMQDAGFDVKNPRDVRQELGGMPEFKDFITLAKQRGFKIKADLVLNHLSDKHEWFKRLENGDETALEYFIYKTDMPEYKKYQDEKLGTVIEYKEDDGSISKRRLIFPENTENHYRKVTVNNNDYYLYHTFYPFQLDLNWENPEVLYYMLDTISNWANMGIDVFRMDAIPYLSKEKGTNAENQPKTHAIVNILSNYLQLSAPSSVIQVEACQMPKDIIPYFGKERDIKVNIENTQNDIKRTSEAQIAYNFPMMNAIWATLIAEDKKYFIDNYKKIPNIPESASWSTFLRVHDELTLEMVSPEIRKLIFDDLISKGSNFRNGFGVSGRLANFLDKNPSRIEVAYSILLSTPGIPIIYYGDEVGALNNYDNAQKSAENRFYKTRLFKNMFSAFDSRDINRGKIPQKLFYGSTRGYYEFNSKVYNKVKNLIAIRKQLPVMTNGEFQILNTKNKSNFAYIRKNKEQQILVINNLSKEKLYADITLPVNIILKNDGNIKSLKNLINGDNVKVDISLQNRTMHLRIAPYQVLWLEL